MRLILDFGMVDFVEVCTTLLPTETTIRGHQFRSRFALSAGFEGIDSWDTPLIESESFVAVPSLGSLVEGWLLIVPRSHSLSFGTLDEACDDELENFVQKVVKRVSATFGEVAIFEHGPVRQGSKIGCGVDYAHLHVVPTNIDLLHGAKAYDPSIEWTAVKGIKETRAAARNDSEYLFLQQSSYSDLCYLGQSSSQIPSQLFRRIIADNAGRPDQYDWKLFPGYAEINNTVRKLSDSCVQ